MSHRSKKRQSGFSLLEMIVSMAVGTVVLGAAVQIYVQGLNATWTVSQRAELQQDYRAASNLLTKDLSLAGAGLGQGAAIQLPTSSTVPVYGCDQTSTCYINGGSVKYPGTSPFLYGLLPGYNQGPTLLTSEGPTDIVTVVYTDSTFYLDCYTASIASTTSVNFVVSASSANCTVPSGGSIQNVNDASVGLTSGDLILFTFPSTQVVAEVNGTLSSSTTSGVTTYSVPFAATDPLKMNQAASVPKTLASQYSSTTTVTGYGQRILVITYYIDNTVTPARLMRQISGHSPVPVAESVAYLKFTYDLFNSSTSTAAIGCSNPGAATDGCSVAGASTGLLPNQITQINIANMAMDSSVKSTLFAVSGYQTIDLQTSVSARNLTYVNNFAN